VYQLGLFIASGFEILQRCHAGSRNACTDLHCVYGAETAEGKISPFIALLKQYMQRSTVLMHQSAITAKESCDLEERSAQATPQVASLVAQQQACTQAEPGRGLQQTLTSSITQAVQVTSRLFIVSLMHDVGSPGMCRSFE